MAHGRYDERKLKVYGIEPIEAGLPQARTLCVVERKSSQHQGEEMPMAFYHCSQAPEEGCAIDLSSTVRMHWSACEIRNHWVRDALFAEDKTRSKNYNLNANLATLRVCLIALKAYLFPDQPWPPLHEKCQHNPSIAYQLVSNHRLK